MAASNSRSGRKTELQQTKLWREQREISPDRTVVWTEPHNPKLKRVPVLYYLSRNGQLEHPHFMEVPLSSPQGLFLTDVINRLNGLRGKGMASMYSWSCKRSYKNGFVWHDLSENDLIYPVHRHEYVLKGSELPENAFLETGSPSPRQQPPPERQITGGDDQDCPRTADRRRRNQSCSSIDFEYNVYKAEPSGKPAAAADVSTQTDDNHRHRHRHRGGRLPAEMVEAENGKELHRDEIEIEISTPPSGSSPETLETLMKADGRVALRGKTAADEDHTAANSDHHHHHIQRCKSSVLMQLISCGSLSFKDCGAGQGLGLIAGPYKMRVPRGGGTAENGRRKLEETDYFSGSLVETKKQEFPALKRSTSYNADRSPHLELAEKEIEGVKAKCIPRKPKAQSSSRKEGPLMQY